MLLHLTLTSLVGDYVTIDVDAASTTLGHVLHMCPSLLPSLRTATGQNDLLATCNSRPLLDAATTLQVLWTELK